MRAGLVREDRRGRVGVGVAVAANQRGGNTRRGSRAHGDGRSLVSVSTSAGAVGNSQSSGGSDSESLGTLNERGGLRQVCAVGGNNFSAKTDVARGGGSSSGGKSSKERQHC